jgi:hypothetical protein
MQDMLIRIKGTDKAGTKSVEAQSSDGNMTNSAIEATNIFLDKIATLVDTIDWTVTAEISLLFQCNCKPAVSGRFALIEYDCGCTWVGNDARVPELCVRHGDGKRGATIVPDLNGRPEGWNALADF